MILGEVLNFAKKHRIVTGGYGWYGVGVWGRGIIYPLYRRYTAAAGYLAPCTLNSAAPPQRVNNSAIPPSVLGGLGSPMGVPKAPPLKGVLVPSTGGGIAVVYPLNLRLVA